VDTNRQDIIGFNGHYSISEDGCVFSKDRVVRCSKGRIQFVKGQKMKVQYHCTGYLTVGLSLPDGSGKKTYRVHRLVAQAFLKNDDPAKDLVNHIDGNKRNNSVTNLEWCTSQENTDHAVKQGLFNVSGTRNPSAKLTIDNINDCLKLIQEGKMLKDIASHFLVDRNTISQALTREFGIGWKIHQKPQYR